jgi:hypothetical protein
MTSPAPIREVTPRLVARVPSQMDDDSSEWDEPCSDELLAIVRDAERRILGEADEIDGPARVQ